ncbi:MAG: hypothetical protein O7B35_14775 [Deltaproteobacteria bacterium]|nr:hypothetical protein [Deltaproteobacteria bacterium]
MSNKISRWLGPALVVALAVFFMAISSAEAQIKFSQRGFVMFDYKVGINTSQVDRNFRKKESSDFSTTRFRIWNNWRLGEFANAEWMWEVDTILGVQGPKAGSPASGGGLRGDRINIETGIARLDVTIPTTDWHVRIGQQSFFSVLPMLQERIPGIKIYKAGGWIKPTIFYLPEEKTFSFPVTTTQRNDDQIVGAWIDMLPMKGLKFRPYFMWNNRQNEGAVPGANGPLTKNDFQRADFGFESEYKAKGWYVNYLVVGQVGEQDFDNRPSAGAIPTDDRDIGAWASEFGVGYNWGVNTFSFNFLYRTGQSPRSSSTDGGGGGSGHITGWSPIVGFFANKNRQSQLLTSINQHPGFDLEIADPSGPNNDRDAGWQVFGIWWKRPINKQWNFELGFSHIQSDKEIDTDGDFSGDSRVVGEAFDLLVNYKVTKGLTFHTGTAFLIPGDALDAPVVGSVGRSGDAVCCPWALFTSAILRF